MSHYTKYQHPFYKDNHQKWIDTQKIYDGTAYDYFPSLDSDGNVAGTDNHEISRYIPKKAQREHEDAYSERLLLLDPQMRFFTGITSLIGVLFDAEKATDRTWQDEEKSVGLGDPTDPSSVSYKIVHNADGKGTNLDFVMKELAIKLAMKQTVWVCVDGRPKDDKGSSIGEASIKIIDPEFVVNWREDENGKLVWALVKELRDVRTSNEENPDLKECFTEYDLEGWRRFYVQEDAETEISSGKYAYYETTDKSQKILPIFQTKVPVGVNAGYLWAKKSNSLMNQESRLDFAHMTLAFQLLQIVAGDKDEFNLIVELLKNGGNTLMQNPQSSRDHKFLEQDSSFLDSSAKRIEYKVMDFFYSMFKAYGDSAKQKTATEITLESKTGLEAYLTLLVGSLDEAENGILWRLSQVYFPNNTDVWGDASADRKADFAPKDIDTYLDSLQERYFGGKPIPITKGQAKKILKMYFDEDGIALTPEEDTELDSLVEVLLASQTQETGLFGDFDL